MKKFALITFLLLPLHVQAQGGVYDGIWQASNGDFATVTQNGTFIVVVILDSTFLQWDAYQGVINLAGDEVVVNTVASLGNASLRITFTSPRTADVTLLSCLPTQFTICEFPNGTQFTAQKVF